MSKNTFLYYGYGSNLLTKRIHINNPSAVRVGIGKLKNYRLDFNRFSKRWGGCSATIVPHPGLHVWGALWEINMEHLPALDKQEGVNDKIYFRFQVEIELIDGTLQKCFVYQLIETPTMFIKFKEYPNDQLPSQVYRDTIIKGAKESNLPNEYQKLLQKIPHNGFNGDVNLNVY